MAFKINGSPAAQKNRPMIMKAKSILIRILIAVPKHVRMMPISKAFLMPLMSMIQLDGKLINA